MKELQFVKTIIKNICTTIALPAIVVLFSLLSCSGDKKSTAAPIEEPDSIPYLSTYGVTATLDALVTRLKPKSGSSMKNAIPNIGHSKRAHTLKSTTIACALRQQ